MSPAAPTIADLEPLIGTWRIDAALPDSPPPSPLKDTGARTVFEHAAERAFVLQRWTVPFPGAPDGIAIITPDPERGAFRQHYFDSRGVVRLYEMTFDAGVWTLERTRPDFSPLDFAQRWEAQLSDRVIEGRWFTRHGDGDWKIDFALTYTRL